jgi:hypothetical protein
MQREAIELYQNTDYSVSFIARSLSRKYGRIMRDEHIGAVASSEGFTRTKEHRARSVTWATEHRKKSREFTAW